MTKKQSTRVSAHPVCLSLADLVHLSLQAWCVAGNCFSLQREHDIAIKFFQRAIQVSTAIRMGSPVSDRSVSNLSVSQVDPGFAYAYTLLGHEFVLTEELDRALACFRNAIRVNNRHYNAWYVTMVTKVGWCVSGRALGKVINLRFSLVEN